MSEPVTKVLLVEDNPGDARLIREMLREAGTDGFEIEWVSQLSECLDHLAAGKVDLVLLDLGLPDSQGLDTFLTAYARAPEVPFVVLTGLDDETMALNAVRQGAQDYLVKGATEAHALLRAIRYATERKLAERAVEAERKKLYSVLNRLPAFVYLRGADFMIRFANRRFRKIFGEPEDKPCYQVLLGKNEPCENCQPLNVLKTNVPHQFEWTIPGGTSTYEVYNYPLCVDDVPLVLTLGVDITERKQGQHKLRESEQNLRYLASQLLTAQERERKRISRDLHDDLGQSLMTLKLGLHGIERKLPEELSDLRQDLHSKISFIDSIVEDVRRLSRDLRPSILEDLGLTTALTRLFEDFSQYHSVKLLLEIDDIEDLFSSESQLIIYRLFQESLTNIAKHAEATKVIINVNKMNGRVDFCVEDNGRGFNLPQVTAPDPSRKGIGLAAMEERMRMAGGSLEIRSQEDQGTRISFSIPIESDEHNR